MSEFSHYISPPEEIIEDTRNGKMIVLVDAEDEAQARELGRPALHDLYADVRERLGKDVPIEIHTVREATAEEIQLWTWHHEMLAKEKQR